MIKNTMLLVFILFIVASCGKADVNQPTEETVETNLSAQAEPSADANSPIETESPAETRIPVETETLPEPEMPSPEPITLETPISEIRSAPGISSETLNWYSMRNAEHKPPTSSQADIISQYNAYYLGDVTKQTIYVTFDMDYEIGYTEKILDIAKEKDVPLAFFVTKKYIEDNQELVKRIASEGHIVANHSNTSVFLPDLSDEQLVSEILANADYFKQVTGTEMPRFFRVHSVEYSERVLDIATKLGYATVFWSFGYKDWEVDNQPSVEDAYSVMMDNLHSGSIMLLHSVSQTNVQVLPDFIDSVRGAGYSLGSLYDITPNE